MIFKDYRLVKKKFCYITIIIHYNLLLLLIETTHDLVLYLFIKIICLSYVSVHRTIFRLPSYNAMCVSTMMYRWFNENQI